MIFVFVIDDIGLYDGLNSFDMVVVKKIKKLIFYFKIVVIFLN